jgi:hypothetical protein
MMQLNRAPSWPGMPAKPVGWSGRHKQLAIAMGCVGLLVVATLLGGGILVTVAFAALRSSDAYQLALSAAMHEPSVAAELGPPIQAGWFTTGHVTVAGPSGDASLAIPISGSRGSGTLNVSAQKSGGRWTFSVLNVSISGRPAPIDLIPKSP